MTIDPGKPTFQIQIFVGKNKKILVLIIMIPIRGAFDAELAMLRPLAETTVTDFAVYVWHATPDATPRRQQRPSRALQRYTPPAALNRLCLHGGTDIGLGDLFSWRGPGWALGGEWPRDWGVGGECSVPSVSPGYPSKPAPEARDQLF